MARFRYHAPLDPGCPGARKIAREAQIGYDDPMTHHYGAGDVISDMTERKEARHRVECGRCQEYGAANIEVRD